MTLSLGMLAMPAMAQTGNVDVGDAPESYGQVIHAMPSSPTIYLGTVPPDPNTNLLYSDGADGDDYYDDEEGAQPPDLLIGQSSVSITISCTGNGWISGWVDFDRNGYFDADERQNNWPLMCAGGSATLDWPIIDVPLGSSTTYLRIRTASDQSEIATAVGTASDGEVEDHLMRVISSTDFQSACGEDQESVIFEANDLPGIIGPNRNTTTVSTINVPANFKSDDINLVNLGGTHSYIWDLQFWLDRNGQSFRLYGQNCNYLNNFQFGFDNEASGFPPCPPVDGNNYPPANSFTSLYGQDTTGDWTLRIVDLYDRDGGQLMSWSLEFCGPPDPPPLPEPALRIGKVATVVDDVVEMHFRVKNVGDSAIDNLVLVDDLDTAFGAGNYSLVGVPWVRVGLESIFLNPNFDGSSDTDLLINSSLDFAREFEIGLRVRVIDRSGSGGDGVFLNQASVAGSSGATLATDLSAPTLDMTLDADGATVVQFDPRIVLRGNVFIDSGPNAADAHDGVQQVSESGLADATVTLWDPNTSSTLVQTATDAEGRYQIVVPVGRESDPLQLRLASPAGWQILAEAPLVGDARDGMIDLQPDSITSGMELNFAVVPIARLSANQDISLPAGTAFLLPHRLENASWGEVSYLLELSGSLPAAALELALIDDADCDGERDDGEAFVVMPQPTQHGSEHCLLIYGFVPGEERAIGRYTIEISAVHELSMPVGAAALTNTLRNQDNLSVSGSGERLVLSKAVRNLSRLESESTDNAALPGEVLEYIIRFSNQGIAPIEELIVNDAAPNYTELVAGSANCSVTPGPMSCNATATATTVEWRYAGALPAGASGEVRYQVVVQ